ncbi:S1 family peptidase [Amycolatopsis suaedae]|uniref:S1 family peptidase n=1 Tax=Amycolatopsis suaedae TaxID=2510978 RepID=A0A4Q7JEP0_9PSEU|nr:S1 family peptidase [Amycolatopsis suaedae]RZQ65937.1 S1 family peptidase [Amycolatopsis suaedae]
MTIMAACLLSALAPLSPAAFAAPQQVPATDETQAATIEQTLRSTLGEAFGGAWIDDASGALVVGVTDRAKAAEVTRAGARPKLVRTSAAALDAMTDKLNSIAPSVPKWITRWGPDVANNSVTLTVLPGHSEKAKAVAAAAGLSEVRVEESPEVPQYYPSFQGGEAYNIGQSRCSIGFSVRGGFVTAGHCRTETGGGALTKNGQALGQWGGASFPGNDYAWVRTNSSWTPAGSVAGVGPVRGSTEAATGASVTKSGSTTGVTRGTIGRKNQTVNYPQGSVGGLTATNAQCRPGDSGGAFISGTQAQGVVSGGSTSTCYFQPVNEILRVYGLSLVTG